MSCEKRLWSVGGVAFALKQLVVLCAISNGRSGRSVVTWHTVAVWRLVKVVERSLVVAVAGQLKAPLPAGRRP